MKQYKCLLFDLDDTLLDFKITEKFAFNKLMEQNNLPLTEDVFQRYCTINKAVWDDFEKHLLTADEVKYKRFELFCQAYALPLDAVVLGDQYLENLSQSYELIEGAIDLLDRLKSNYKLVLVTNGLSKVQNPRIHSSRMNEYFPLVFISEEVGCSKPSNEFFQHVFNHLGEITKEDILIIGDSMSSDMLGGRNFGIDTCWFNPNQQARKFDVTFEITRLNELNMILL